MSALYGRLAEAVAQMDEEGAVLLAQQIVSEGLPAAEAIEKGLIAGMERVSTLYEQEEYFLTEVLMCADAMDAAFDVLSQHIKAEDIPIQGRVVIGTI